MANSTFLGSSFRMELRQTMWEVTGSQNSNMAAAKPEVLISQLLYGIETKFQRLPYIFEVQLSNGAMENNVRCNQKPEFQYGGRQTGCNYISAPL